MLSRKKTQSNDECNCCRLVRSDKSSRLILPLARRGRPHLSNHSYRLLCKNCLTIKQKQQNEIFQQQQQQHNDENNSQNIFETITDLNKTSEQDNISHEIEFSLINENEKIHLNNSEYETEQMLIWKMNTSDNYNQTNTINDTGSLTNNEKKILLQEAVRKLQIVLNNPSTSTTTTISESDLDRIQFTYRALQTTVNILSSSLDSL
ncbi:unnamed protein product [Adineta steineri]|uniref:Uncharacterized protein n=1 Tax=Adineta steineri TaxID=433720 RepID=A0A814BTL3_9BILA|nr:unnamed protein product [Adineta steineri]